MRRSLPQVRPGVQQTREGKKAGALTGAFVPEIPNPKQTRESAKCEKGPGQSHVFLDIRIRDLFGIWVLGFGIWNFRRS
jgi:hypothetical protein